MFQTVFNQVLQLCRVERFDEIILRTVLESRNRRFKARMAGNQDHIGRIVRSAGRFQDIQAVFAGHDHIGQNQIEGLLSKQPDRFVATGTGRNQVLFLKKVLVQVAKKQFIIDNQDV